jgi:hypothetical protein
MHHRTVSGAPGSSTLNLPALGIWGSRFAIIHRTVRCNTGLSGVPAEQRLLRANGRLQVNSKRKQCASARAEVRAGARRRTGQWTGPIRCTTGLSGGPTCQSWVTWLAHRSVSGGASDCPVRHTTDSLPNDHFGGWGYKYPQPPLFKASKHSLHLIQYKSNTQHSKSQIKASDRIKVPNSTLVFWTCEEIDLCSFVAVVAWLAFFFLSFLLSIGGLRLPKVLKNMIW